MFQQHLAFQWSFRRLQSLLTLFRRCLVPPLQLGGYCQPELRPDYRPSSPVHGLQALPHQRIACRFRPMMLEQFEPLLLQELCFYCADRYLHGSVARQQV